MNTHYTKDDVVELASVIFVNDINSQAIANEGVPTKDIAGASFFAAETFFNMAAAYHNGELDKTLNACHDNCESCDPEDRRKGERRGSESVDPDADARAAIEQALKEQFLAATLQSIFRNAKS